MNTQSTKDGGFDKYAKAPRCTQFRNAMGCSVLWAELDASIETPSRAVCQGQADAT